MMSNSERQKNNEKKDSSSSIAAQQREWSNNNLSAAEEEGEGQIALLDLLTQELVVVVVAPDVVMQKLRAEGLTDVRSIANATVAEIRQATGLSMEKSAKLCTAARLRLGKLGKSDSGFASASQLYQERKKHPRIATGSMNLDDLLGGGVETGAITEVYGEYGTGKTQLCFTLSVMVQQQEKPKGGLGGKALYIDTENTYRHGERVCSIASARGFNAQETLQNITVASPSDSIGLRHIVEKQVPCFLAANPDVKLVVVDSIVSLLRAEYRGRETLAPRQQALNAIMNALSRIARRHDIAVVVTNQVMSSPDPYFCASNKKTAVGGHVLAHASTYRIFLKKSGRNRVARMEDSPCHATREVLFTLTEKGVDDIHDKWRYYMPQPATTTSADDYPDNST
jgi:DNA repair protein RadA